MSTFDSKDLILRLREAGTIPDEGLDLAELAMLLSQLTHPAMLLRGHTRRKGGRGTTTTTSRIQGPFGVLDNGVGVERRIKPYVVVVDATAIAIVE